MVAISDFSFDNPRFRILLDRTKDTPQEIIQTVAEILSEVRARGDEALFEYMERFDGEALNPETILVTEEEFEQAREGIEPEFGAALKEACHNLFAFHQHQLPKSYHVDYPEGVKLQRTYRPLDRVGVCVPGGAAPLASTLYMNLIPALTAGVPNISIISTPRRGTIPAPILYVAEYLDVKKVYKISGAQGVAALAYGTASVDAVDKIVGPGNIFTQTAKRLLYGTVGIDSLAGPSEIVIIADDSAPAAYVAADLLSQAEHGSGFEASVAFCLSVDKAEEISAELLRFAGEHDLDDAVAQALLAYGNIFIVDDLGEALDAVNALAPEHLEIMCDDAEDLLPAVHTAGAVFLGRYSTEPVGDYYCGTNHVLPTGGTARFSSGLSVPDFLRGVSVVTYTKEAIDAHGDSIRALARAEGLRAHELAVEVRQA